MKTLFTLLFIANMAFSFELKVNEINPYQELEGMFKLSNSKSVNFYYVLDCMSFFKKFDIRDQNHQLINEYYITLSECKYLYDVTNQCLKTHGYKCIDSEAPFNDDCLCSDEQ